MAASPAPGGRGSPHVLAGPLNVRWLVTAGHDGTWIAFGVWALVFTAMLTSLARSYRRLTKTSSAGIG